MEILEALGTKRPIGARGTSGSSLSLYVNLEGNHDAGYKPFTKRGQRWNGEIAAYRLSRLLKIGRVPPCISRRFRLPTFQHLLEDEPLIVTRLETGAVPMPNNSVLGALCYWVPDIYPAEVDREDDLPRWTEWLRQGRTIPRESLGLARQLSDMIVFDYITGNWDRWSGGNVLFGPDKRTLVIMDNNAAFNAKMSKRINERNRIPLEQVERFSASLFRRIVAVTEDDFRRELAHDPEADRLLTNAQIAAAFQRRDEVIDRIESLSREHGRDAVLCFQ